MRNFNNKIIKNQRVIKESVDLEDIIFDENISNQLISSGN